MKKIIFIVALAIILSGTSHAKVEQIEKQVGDFKVKLAMEMEHHNKDGHHESGEGEHHNSVGGNKLGITIHDSEGNAVTNAKVKVDYSMPPKKNMPPMKYTARARLDGDTYRTKVNFTMQGNWDITVYIKTPGNDLIKVDFDMHVM